MQLSRTALVSLLVVAAASFGASAETTQPGTPSAPTSKQQQTFTTTLAKAELTKQGITTTNTSPANYKIAFDAAVKDIAAQRSDGLGWGAIANKMGLNWGKVVSASQHETSAARASERQDGAAHAQNQSGEGHASANGGNGGAGHSSGAGGGKK
ncbi:MAG: hypothetical protein HXX19_20925 [Rhodoferax sp.]|nr:hypothetical protein [Rhodoferax sp.]